MQLLALMNDDPFLPISGVFDLLLYIMSEMFQLMFSIVEMALNLAP